MKTETFTLHPVLSYGILGISLFALFTVSYLLQPKNKVENNEELAKFTHAVLKTSEGDIEIEFLKDKALKTVENFVKLSFEDFYNGTKFHRVVPDFIQGGDPLSRGDDMTLYGRGGPGYKFDDEINDELMVRGVVAMANSGPNTNGSQFFIVTAKETPWLLRKHTVFAKVVKGIEVAQKISNMQTKNQVPLVSIILEDIELK